MAITKEALTNFTFEMSDQANSGQVKSNILGAPLLVEKNLDWDWLQHVKKESNKADKTNSKIIKCEAWKNRLVFLVEYTENNNSLAWMFMVFDDKLNWLANITKETTMSPILLPKIYDFKVSRNGFIYGLTEGIKINGATDYTGKICFFIFSDIIDLIKIIDPAEIDDNSYFSTLFDVETVIPNTNGIAIGSDAFKLIKDPDNRYYISQDFKDDMTFSFAFWNKKDTTANSEKCFIVQFSSDFQQISASDATWNFNMEVVLPNKKPLLNAFFTNVSTLAIATGTNDPNKLGTIFWSSFKEVTQNNQLQSHTWGPLDANIDTHTSNSWEDFNHGRWGDLNGWSASGNYWISDDTQRDPYYLEQFGVQKVLLTRAEQPKHNFNRQENVNTLFAFRAFPNARQKIFDKSVFGNSLLETINIYNEMQSSQETISFSFRPRNLPLNLARIPVFNFTMNEIVEMVNAYKVEFFMEYDLLSNTEIDMPYWTWFTQTGNHRGLNTPMFVEESVKLVIEITDIVNGTMKKYSKDPVGGALKRIWRSGSAGDWRNFYDYQRVSPNDFKKWGKDIQSGFAKINYINSDVTPDPSNGPNLLYLNIMTNFELDFEVWYHATVQGLVPNNERYHNSFMVDIIKGNNNTITADYSCVENNAYEGTEPIFEDALTLYVPLKSRENSKFYIYEFDSSRNVATPKQTYYDVANANYSATIPWTVNLISPKDLASIRVEVENVAIDPTLLELQQETLLVKTTIAKDSKIVVEYETTARTPLKLSLQTTTSGNNMIIGKIDDIDARETGSFTTTIVGGATSETVSGNQHANTFGFNLYNRNDVGNQYDGVAEIVVPNITPEEKAMTFTRIAALRQKDLFWWYCFTDGYNGFYKFQQIYNGASPYTKLPFRGLVEEFIPARLNINKDSDNHYSVFDREWLDKTTNNNSIIHTTTVETTDGNNNFANKVDIYGGSNQKLFSFDYDGTKDENQTKKIDFRLDVKFLEDITTDVMIENKNFTDTLTSVFSDGSRVISSLFPNSIELKVEGGYNTQWYGKLDYQVITGEWLKEHAEYDPINNKVRIQFSAYWPKNNPYDGSVMPPVNWTTIKLNYANPSIGTTATPLVINVPDHCKNKRIINVAFDINLSYDENGTPISFP